MVVSGSLILTAGFGEGHNAAARSLAAALGAGAPDHPVAVHDVFAEAYGVRNEVVRRLYLTAINRTPALWGVCFYLLDHTPLPQWHMPVYQAAARRLRYLLEEMKPEAVISVYPGCGHLLDYSCRDRLRRPFRSFTVITDSITICTAWHTVRADAFFVPNERSRRVLLDRGIPASKVLAPGFPVPLEFENLAAEHAQMPNAGEPWKVLYMVNSAEHLAASVCEALLGIEKVALTVAVGHNERLGHRLRRQAGDRNLEIVGWAPDMPRLMAGHHVLVGKAGGATVQECLAAGTPMIISQIVPGQEEGNATLILDAGAGFHAESPAEIRDQINALFAGDGNRWARAAEAARTLGTPGAARQIAHHVITKSKQCCPTRALNGSPIKH